MRVIDALPRMLGHLGVDRIFGVLGGSNAAWMTRGVDEGIFDFVMTRHEETAVHAATGYARASGRVGVCTATRGPGFANSINGLLAAAQSHVPVVLLVGESPTVNTRQRYTEQNVEQEAISGLIGVDFQHVGGPSELRSAVEGAFTRALWNGQPQVVSIDNDIGAEEVADDLLGLADRGLALGPPRRGAEAESIQSVVDAVEASQRPLVLAGQGAVLSEAREQLVELGELVGARFATSLRANRFFAGHPHDLGLCGTWSAPAVRDLLAATDLVLAFGASLNPKTTYNDQIFAGARVAQCEIDVERPFMASSPDLALVGDAAETVESLTREWKRRGLPRREVAGPPTPTMAERKRSILEVDLGHDPQRGLDVRAVVSHLDDVLPGSRIVVTDSGRTVGVTASLVDAENARSWLVGRGYGSTGLGLGTAIGASAAQPDRPVVLFAGDNGFMSSIAALDTARLYDVNVTVIVLNDEQLGSEVKYLGKFQLPHTIIRQDMPDVAQLAATFGGVGHVVTTMEELKEVDPVPDGLCIVDARLDPGVNGLAAYR